MDKLVIALFETSVALIMFYVVFVFWLKKETFFKANRFYLLMTASFSLFIPWLNFSLSNINTTTLIVYNLLDAVSVSTNGYEQALIKTLTGWQWLFAVYALGVAITLGMLIINMIKITRIDIISYPNLRIKEPKRVRFIKADVVPFSFLNKIYINPNAYSQKQLNDIIAHESVHITQQHTYDCLFYELLIVFFWFNPIVYKYRASAKELHEYLADEGAIKSGIAELEYEKLLFEQATGLKILSLPNSFNYSLIKRRLIMLTKIKSSKIARARLLLAIPIVSLLVLVFSCEKTEVNGGVVVKDTVNLKGGELLKDKVYMEVDIMPEFPGGNLALREYIAQNIKYPKLAKEKGISGRVFVQFVIDATGSVFDVKIVRGVHKLLDDEAVRVISTLPKWKPGEKNDKKVKVSFTIPINFELN